MFTSDSNGDVLLIICAICVVYNGVCKHVHLILCVVFSLRADTLLSTDFL